MHSLRPQSLAVVIEAQMSLPGGAILFDAGASPQAQPAWFEPERTQAEARADRGGRGAVWFLDLPCGAAVLRHYRRGGAVAKLNRDRYLWLGAERTRSFSEFRLLAALHGRGLPVPAPLAARYQRIDPLWYRADLLMQRIPHTRTLAEVFAGLQDQPAALEMLGETLAQFHAAGVSHADLNAHNVLHDDAGRWWLIDFDRGQLRDPAGDWWQAKLERLARSLRKLALLHDAAAQQAWRRVLDAHAAALAGARA